MSCSARELPLLFATFAFLPSTPPHWGHYFPELVRDRFLIVMLTGRAQTDDFIRCMKDGEVVELGSHSNLMSENVEYANAFR